MYIGARSEDKAQGAVNAILETSPFVPKENLGIFVADFADLKQVKTAAEKFITSETRLDILVNNAALYVKLAPDAKHRLIRTYRLARPLDKDANGISVSMITKSATFGIVSL